MAIPVVPLPLLLVGQHVVRLGRLLELLLGLGIIRIPVRMILHGFLAVRLFDLLLGGILIDSENVVVIFRHEDV